MPDLTFKRFDLRKIKPNSVCAFVGRRGTGKTTLTEDVVGELKWIPDGVVFSGTEDCNSTWGQHFPESFIYDGYRPDIMAKVIKRQRVQAAKRKLDPRVKINPTIVLCEDIMYDKSAFIKDKNARGVMMNGRHWGILLLITVQYMMDLSRDLRNCIDFLFVLAHNSVGDRERLWKNWFGVVPTFDAFNSIMLNLTKGQGSCLVLDNTCNSDKIEDCIYWYKAKLRGPYKVGSKGYWMYHYINKKDDYDMAMAEHLADDDEIGVKRAKRPTYRIRKAA
jgi:hypothetical protein